MGVVYRATDTHLARDVAVKILRAGFSLNSAAARRFEDEARITAQLQHPFIPAVHDLGTLSDGRPFLAMKLIKGQTLDAHLAKRTDPSADRGHLVAVFEQICQGVGYAHAHGVIHRDLKPSNVMVGSFGEVQVMDWGLAKVLSATRSPPPDAAIAETRAETAIHSLRDSDGSETQAGSVLGTPAFMPPEQAIGAVDQIDERSDVFGLGGILAAILTGRPPYQGETSESTRQMAAMGRVQDCFTRLDASGADPELVALAKRCLAVEKESRPANAGEVARAVADLREAADERARRAELDRATTAARMVERRKRRRLAAAATTVVVIGLASIAIIQWQNARRQAAEEARTRAAKELAEDRLRQATDIWYTQVIDVQNELDDQNISPVLRRKLLRAAREKIIDLLKDQPRSREVDHMMHVLHRRLSNASLALGELAEAEREWQECHAIAEARLRDDADAPDARKDLASSHITLGDIKDRANDLPAALAEYDRATAMLVTEASDRRVIDDLLRLAVQRGDVLVRMGRSSDALAAYQAGLDRARRASASAPEDVRLGSAHMLLARRRGEQAVQVEMFGEAEAHYRESLAILDRLQKADPNNPQFLRDRAAGLRELGNLEFGRERISAARRYYLQALELRQRLTEKPGASPQAFVDLGLAFERLGSTSSFVRDYDRAAAEFGEEVANLRRALYREDDPARQEMLAGALNEFGNALQGARRWGEARAACNDSLTMRRQLRTQGRDAVGLAVSEAETLSFLAFLEREPPFHDFAAALEHARAGVKLLDPLEKAGRLEGQANWKRTADVLRQNVDYLEWAVRTLDPLEQVLTRGSTDKALLLRARVLASRGKTAEVLETANALDRLPKQFAGHLAAARAYLLALASAPHPADEPFASQAVEAIRKAITAGADRQVIANDPDFASLRQRDDFKKVVASDG
jgi:tetratricopeptide (TPR) repeat protein